MYGGREVQNNLNLSQTFKKVFTIWYCHFALPGHRTYVFIVLFRLWSLGNDTDSHPATARLHNPSVASKENVSNLILKSSPKHSSS